MVPGCPAVHRRWGPPAPQVDGWIAFASGGPLAVGPGSSAVWPAMLRPVAVVVVDLLGSGRVTGVGGRLTDSHMVQQGPGLASRCNKTSTVYTSL
ncbi:hypothetical protein BRADI_1g22175v3 [Brachypodium distachyon]|uniref:Uncharacterized protein n=1 Tax=Brachypodium distachyon TaxID=15368 RepID=A0A2K2DKK2_BRADI|nr:hypothetical protein BRADI_1g22175v3 [Brachypodium distachyon]